MTPSYLLLYVSDMQKSRAFYADLLGATAVEAAPTFSLFVLANGLKIGLWQKDGVEPKATLPGGMEIGFPVENDQIVNDTAATWAARGVNIIQPLTDADFGRTFTALDPDGCRLRVFHVAM